MHTIPARTAALFEEMRRLDPEAAYVEDAGSIYVQVEPSLFPLLERRGYDAVRCGDAVRVAPSMPDTLW